MVTEPTVDAIIDAAVLYLHRADTRLDEVFEARIVLEVIAAELATERLTEEDAAGLRTLEEAEERDHRALHARLAAITGNPALELFVDILNRVAFLYFRGRRRHARRRHVVGITGGARPHRRGGAGARRRARPPAGCGATSKPSPRSYRTASCPARSCPAASLSGAA